MIHDDVEKNFLCQCNLETFVGNNIVIIDMFVYVLYILFYSLGLFVSASFISESKFQVYGIFHDVFFFKREIKGHWYCLSNVFSMHIFRKKYIEKNFLCQCNLETFVGNNIVIIDMFVYVLYILFYSLGLFVSASFISESKFQVYGIFHDVFFFSKEKLKDTGIV